ncbi:bifunctional adenosylcobinamide kinase/adenosylcobinamide-phosphate guanylyltransferase, partial [Paracoccus denitrificans]
CLTLWLSNLMADGDDPGPRVRRLCEVLGTQDSPVVLVTNELGLGIVPENALARRFRDEHGWMNQAVARVADEVWMAVSGLPLCLKPQRGTP